MFGKFFGRKDKNGSTGPFYRPYKSDAANHIYNLLFCDNPSLFKRGEGGGGALAAVLSDSTDREMLERIGNDLDAESRVRVLAFNRQRAMKVSVARKRLLGTIIEFPQPQGLDTLAIFPDGRLRYINQSEKMVIFETSPPAIADKATDGKASKDIEADIHVGGKPLLDPKAVAARFKALDKDHNGKLSLQEYLP